jgi:hypothetical protein
MPGPYDYTINIPQPPAQNFLQSLLGIQQLKGLQQQNEIAAQQQAFAAQQQPLQLQQLKEQIAASQASQAHTAAATGLLGVQTEEAKRKNEQLAAFQSEALKLADAPESWNASNLKSLAMKSAAVNPESFNAMRNLMADLPNKESNLLTSAASTTLLAVQQGKPDIAKGILDDQIKAAQEANLGTATTFLKAARSQLDTNPEAAALSATSFLLSANPKAFDDTLKALEAPGKMAQTTALAEEAQAKAKKALGEVPGQEKSLPSAILRENAAIDKKVAAANEMADKLSQAAEAMRGLPSVGSAKEWWTNVKPKLGFGENPEIAVRTNAAQLAGLGMLGAESSAMGGAIRSNVQFQYATSKLPDAWSAPQEVAKRLDAQAEVQRKLAQLMTIDAEWNSAFRGSQKATKDEQILGMDVEPGTTKAKFKEMAAKQLFPPKETLTSSPTPSTGGGTPDLTGGTINLGGGNTATFKLKK